MTTTDTYRQTGGDFEPFPEHRRGRRGRTILLVICGLLLVLLIALGAAVFSYQRQVDPPGPPGEEVEVVIPMGSSTQRIGTILADEDVISSASTFKLYTRINPAGPFQAGEYTFRRNMSMGQAIGVLEEGPEIEFEQLTVPEGLTIGQIGDHIGDLEGRSKEAFVAAADSGQVRSRYQPAGINKIEGLMLPETYNVEPKDDEAKILTRMVTSFDELAAQLGYDGAQEKIGLSPYEAIIVASLVERETRFDEERAKVAQVILNRLRAGMPLQVDATVIYALGKSADRNVRVLFSDLEVDSPYNTYKIKGLPPTPIAAPGRASLEAVLNPEPGDFLFYVVTESDGRHSFATTGAEHQANIRKAEANGVR
ncbi:MAG TPA: endolytic transglycosylase MltG [Acidimicrobiales bacterium]|nr:endolytic transglycosylase MltG [Acidimicrobiales bacterium]